jgi:16S rRNA (uracil1498-N3)-methyltransferase
MEYFYVKMEDVTSHGLTLRGDESKHLVRVLRKNVGDRIFVTDGNEMMYEAIISKIGKTDTQCTIAAIHHKYNEPTVDVTLAVSLLKNPARFDYLIEKTTELGVRTLLPITCERTISHTKNIGRMEKIACSAMKQCGRSWLPRIQPVQSFQSVLENSAHYQLKFILHEKTNSSRNIITEKKFHEDVHSLLLIVGPEGGFTDDEITRAEQSGMKSVSLGTRRLRAETAAIVAVSYAMI